MIHIILPGEPIRRISPTFSKIRTYDSQKHLLHAAKFQTLDQTKRYAVPFVSCVPVEVELNFYFAIPKGKENLFHWNLLDMIDTPDADNLCKFYLDVLKKIVFEDDRQVFRITAKKEYDENPRTEIYIVPKKPDCDEKVKEVLSIISPDQFCELSADLSYIADFKKINSINFEEDFEHIAFLICEFAEKHAENLRKINKKFPGLAKILKERMENK
jgi:Holliday junction resolvase RusA-like endonuclease